MRLFAGGADGAAAAAATTAESPGPVSPSDSSNGGGGGSAAAAAHESASGQQQQQQQQLNGGDVPSGGGLSSPSGGSSNGPADLELAPSASNDFAPDALPMLGMASAAAAEMAGGQAADASLERPLAQPPDGVGGAPLLPLDAPTRLEHPIAVAEAITATATPVASPASVPLSDEDVEDDVIVVHDDPGSDHADDGPQITWRPQNQQTTCEFTHIITDYAKKRESGCKKAEYSATTVDSQGNRWRLIVYVNGNGRASNHHLSLFLQVADADDLPFGWKKAVSYVLTLEHPSGPNLGYAKRNPDKTFKLCPKAIDWGWSQFITSDRIQQEGYILNDSLTVRASVTVKSSSVSIDPEDAELYLKCAVEEGSPDAVEACLVQGAGVNCQFKDDLYTPLHTACSSSTNEGSVDVLKLLLKRGADPNACNKWRETPLLIAANNGHRAAVEGLLDNGADPSLCSEAGWSALTFAAHKGYDDIVTLLLSAEAPINCRVAEDLSTPLHKACAGGKAGHLAAVKLLLLGGADVHALNKWRETPLLTAANHGQAKAVEALLRGNADPCKCTDTGWSPLSIAAYKGHDEVVQLLLEEGAPTEEADPTLSALLQAATKGLPDTVDLLLQHGADHTVTTKKGDTALSILVEQDLIDAAVDMVSEYNASISRCSRDRKKVQRARLLINLQMKKREKEGSLKHWDDTEDSEPDASDEDNNNIALHDSDASPEAVAPTSAKKKKKGKKPASLAAAEAQAKAAEEALLMELAQEETTAQKNEAKNETKRNKKKKKKERERQQKLQEEKERREREEQKAAEREKERKQKLEEEMIEREQKAREEMEKKKRAHEERQRVEREKKEKARKEAAEKEAKEAAERKEREVRERRQREQEKKDRERRERLEKKANEVNAAQKAAAEAAAAEAAAVQSKKERAQKSKSAKKQKGPSKANKAKASHQSPQPASDATAAQQSAAARKRGWETTTPVNTPSVPKLTTSNPNMTSSGPPPPLASPSAFHAQSQPNFSPLPSPTASSSVRRDSGGQTSRQGPPMPPFEDNISTAVSVEDQLEDMATGVLDFLGFDADAPSNGPPPNQSQAAPPAAAPVVVGNASHPSTPTLSKALASGALGQAGLVELPAVSIFQQEKVAALLQRCAIARSTPPSAVQDPLATIDERTLKTVVYRWIVRAAHESSQHLDSIIPSWTDAGMLAQYLQRQFISESRRGMARNSGAGMVSMEVLKEAGSTLALLCEGFAKEVAEFRSKCAQQLPQDWSDNTINISANEVVGNDSQSTVIVIDWAGRSQVYISFSVFAKLRDRYRGPPSRLLTAIFSTAKTYETYELIVGGTRLACNLQPAAIETMGHEANAAVELWMSPISVHGGNSFCGVFPEVDVLFGGLPPFGKGGGGGEEALVKYGGSVIVVPPLESTTASLYMRTIINSLERADSNGVGLSFIMVLPIECFPTAPPTPSANDLCMLDSRLSDQQGIMVRRVEILPPGQHAFTSSGNGINTSDVSGSSSLFALLQNEAGKHQYPIDDGTLGSILRSMTPGFAPIAKDNVQPMPGPSAQGDVMTVGSFEGVGRQDNFIAPMTDVMGGGSSALGGEVIGGGLGDRSRRGRLFDLVDNGTTEAEAGNDVDVMSGMLNGLNVNMFQGQVSQDVDIEAISLMGIGSGALGDRNGPGRHSRGF